MSEKLGMRSRGRRMLLSGGHGNRPWRLFISLLPRYNVLKNITVNPMAILANKRGFVNCISNLFSKHTHLLLFLSPPTLSFFSLSVTPNFFLHRLSDIFMFISAFLYSLSWRMWGLRRSERRMLTKWSL